MAETESAPNFVRDKSHLDLPLVLDWDQNEYMFWCRLVEVKGPGDRLMDRQVCCLPTIVAATNFI
jgi:hypothetical protein